MTLLHRIRTAAARRAAYHRTLHELSRLSPALAEDLGILPGEAGELARRAVYGR